MKRLLAFFLKLLIFPCIFAVAIAFKILSIPWCLVKKIKKDLLEFAEKQLWPIVLFLVKAYCAITYYFVRKHIKIEILKQKGAQLFILSRIDMGTFPLLIEYARLWNRERKPSCLVLITSNMELAYNIAINMAPELPIIVPQDLLIVRALKHSRFTLVNFEWLFQLFLFNHLTAYLKAFYLDRIALYETPMKGEHPMRIDYHHYWDEQLEKYRKNFSKAFIDAYINHRMNFDLNQHCYYDYIALRNSGSPVPASERTKNALISLKKLLGLKRPFVVLNINTKKYGLPSIKWRTVEHPERYNSLIDAIIKRGYDVVLQGRKEQPHFYSRAGLIDYAHSSCASIENDFALYYGCEFIVSSKSGPESFGTGYDKPTLGLNYIDFCHGIPNRIHRYFFKKIFNPKTSSLISWEELLKQPVFFNLAEINRKFDSHFHFYDLEEEEILEAGEEFLSLMEKPPEKRSQPTPLQEAFRNSLTPLHMDLFRIPGLPCDTYLRRYSEKIFNSEHAARGAVSEAHGSLHEGISFLKEGAHQSSFSK